MTPDVTDDIIMTAMRAFVLNVLSGVECIQGQSNRVPEPRSDDFVVMTGTHRSQLSTTTHVYSATSGLIGRSNLMTIQLDVYGPNSNDNAQVIATLFRDTYGCDLLAPYGIQPLHCDDGHQMPLINGEYQYQDRWTLNAVLQANPDISIPVETTSSVNAKLTKV